MNILVQKVLWDSVQQGWVFTLDRPIPVERLSRPDDVVWVTAFIKQVGDGRFSTTLNSVRRYGNQSACDMRFLATLDEAMGSGWVLEGDPFTVKHDLIPSNASDQVLGSWAAGLMPYIQDAHV